MRSAFMLAVTAVSLAACGHTSPPASGAGNQGPQDASTYAQLLSALP